MYCGCSRSPPSERNSDVALSPITVTLTPPTFSVVNLLLTIQHKLERCAIAISGRAGMTGKELNERPNRELVDWSDLRTFYAVATAGSMNAAAEQHGRHAIGNFETPRTT